MDKEEIIRRLKKISRHAVHVAGEPPFILSLDDGIALDEAVRLLKEQEAKTGKWILDDEDANSWECSECGGLLLINDGTPHENDWYFCPYCGSKLEVQEVKWDE